MRAQQEVLKRRKTNSWQAGVKDRRAKASRYLNDPEFKKACDEENRKKFKERQAMEEPEPTSGFRIIVPITPFGMPEYDGGERFDLRLPYVDNGWVDEDADPVKQFRRFIGLDKKQSNGSEVQGGRRRGRRNERSLDCRSWTVMNYSLVVSRTGVEDGADEIGFPAVRIRCDDLGFDVQGVRFRGNFGVQVTNGGDADNG